MSKENIGYYESDIHTSRNEDSVYTMTYASQQMLIEKLQQENQKLKKQLEVGEQQYNDLVEEKENLQEQLSSNTLQFETQQKEFIEYLESEMILFQEYMKEIECSDRCHGDYPITYYTSKYRLNEVTEILSKYKEIIGQNNG